MNCKYDFQTCQIVYLEHEDARLYAEVIQVIPARQMGWVRPLVLVTGVNRTFQSRSSGEETAQIKDLRAASDLLWPIEQFQPALDLDVIPLLAHLPPLDVPPERDPFIQKQMSQFIQKICRVEPQP